MLQDRRWLVPCKSREFFQVPAKGCHMSAEVCVGKQNASFARHPEQPDEVCRSWLLAFTAYHGDVLHGQGFSTHSKNTCEDSRKQSWIQTVLVEGARQPQMSFNVIAQVSDPSVDCQIWGSSKDWLWQRSEAKRNLLKWHPAETTKYLKNMWIRNIHGVGLVHDLP